MRDLDANIDRAAAFAAGAALSPFSLIAIAARLLTTLGAGRGIDSALDQRCRSLGLNLRRHFGSILRKRYRLGRNWKGRNLDHGITRLTSTFTRLFSHMRNEHLVNPKGINMILNKCHQIILLNGFFGLEVQP